MAHLTELDTTRPNMTVLITSKTKFKGALSGLRQFLATESLLKMMHAFYLTFNESSFRFQDIFKFLFCLFGHVKGRLN